MSRRRSGCLVALVVLLLIAGGVLVVVDRVGVGIAEERVAEQIASRGGLAGRPAVDIAGFPFLTQALSGEYEDVRIRLTAEELGQPAGTSADVSLRGVHVPLSDALGGSVQQIPVDRVDGTATLSWSLLAAQLGGDTTLSPEGDGIRLTKSVEVLGFDFHLVATGTVALDGGDVVVDVQDATAGAVDVPDAVVRQAEELLDFRYPVPALPFGLQLTALTPTADGVTIDVAARDTVLSG
ncbi:LmeA family phospholipid-binding protein [Modestobacter versicolor]|uniref:LmeA family phospholipid-binding protein n=1 Tax=Modestobacter versicolor TaxID=429133 RepID=UPI0034DF4406